MKPLHIPLDDAALLVSSLGSSRFPAQLWDWLTRRLPLTHIACARYNQPAAGQPIESVDWLFSQGNDDPNTPDEMLQLYLDGLWRLDPLLPHMQSLEGSQLVQLRSADLQANEYFTEMFASGYVAEETTLMARSGDGIYAIAVYRTRQYPAFRLDELTLLRQLAELILPLIVQHARLTVSTRRSSSQSLTDLFDRRLATLGIKLSPRERATCHGILHGQSAHQVADTLSVRESSVKTYLDRAFAKLDIRSRTDLFTWCLNGSRGD